MTDVDLVKATFISSKRYERIDIRGSVSITASGVINEQSVTYNLGYIPFFRLFLQYPGRSFYEPLVQSPVDQGGYFDYEVKTDIIDNSHISIFYLNNTINPDPTIVVYYRIYAEPQL